MVQIPTIVREHSCKTRHIYRVAFLTAWYFYGYI